MGVLTLK